MDRQRDGWRERQTYRQIHGWINRQKDIEMDTEVWRDNKHIDRQSN